MNPSKYICTIDCCVKSECLVGAQEGREDFGRLNLFDLAGLDVATNPLSVALAHVILF